MAGQLSSPTVSKSVPAKTSIPAALNTALSTSATTGSAPPSLARANTAGGQASMPVRSPARGHAGALPAAWTHLPGCPAKPDYKRRRERYRRAVNGDDTLMRLMELDPYYNPNHPANYHGTDGLLWRRGSHGGHPACHCWLEYLHR
jgi:hypothetical protein